MRRYRKKEPTDYTFCRNQRVTSLKNARSDAIHDMLNAFCYQSKRTDENAMRERTCRREYNSRQSVAAIATS